MTFSNHYPTHHLRAGQQTFFVPKIMAHLGITPQQAFNFAIQHRAAVIAKEAQAEATRTKPPTKPFEPTKPFTDAEKDAIRAVLFAEITDGVATKSTTIRKFDTEKTKDKKNSLLGFWVGKPRKGKIVYFGRADLAIEEEMKFENYEILCPHFHKGKSFFLEVEYNMQKMIAFEDGLRLDDLHSFFFNDTKHKESDVFCKYLIQKI